MERIDRPCAWPDSSQLDSYKLVRFILPTSKVSVKLSGVTVKWSGTTVHCWQIPFDPHCIRLTMIIIPFAIMSLIRVKAIDVQVKWTVWALWEFFLKFQRIALLSWPGTESWRCQVWAQRTVLLCNKSEVEITLPFLTSMNLTSLLWWAICIYLIKTVNCTVGVIDEQLNIPICWINEHKTLKRCCEQPCQFDIKHLPHGWEDRPNFPGRNHESLLLILVCGSWFYLNAP